MNADPTPGVLSTRTEPPWASATWRTMESPSPVPPGLARSGVVDSIEPFKDAIEVLRWNADAGVRDGQLRVASDTSRRREHLAPVGCVTNRVLEQVLDEVREISLGSEYQQRRIHVG